jgi:hypothetical protein
VAHPGFIVEFNNPSTYGRQFNRQLRGLGLKAKRLSHKTAWLLNYDGQFDTFGEFREAIAASIKANGSALIVSRKTRQAWVMHKTARRSGEHHLTTIY